MDYEKKYKEALERAKMYQGITVLPAESMIETIFPELKESEDERIRKAILNYLTKMWGNSQDDVCGVHVEDAIAWLEKQGVQKSLDDVAKEVAKNKETAMSFLKSCGIMNANGELADEYKIEQGGQNPDDKVEPKFKVGDAIKITGINNGYTGYSILNTEDGYYYNWKLVENKPT